jgi:hypothetical protein
VRFLWILLALPLWAQHDMGVPHDMQGMNMQSMSGTPADPPMQASGTSFNPASSPMNMAHFHWANWKLMVHGVAFVTAIQQTGPRGTDKVASMNWLMGEASHTAFGGTFTARSMISLEPATVADRRYPELFQTGETAYGKPIVDAQHPHNLFMELALEYQHRLGEKSRVWFYAAPVGDPALGPVAFPHRASAAELPQAALGHHLEDSTHISYEVITGGIAHGMFGIEASGFHGGEPNENRWNIGHGAIDSWSARLTVTPNANWTGQISTGRLTQPEALEPGDQERTTASVTWVRPFSRGHWATSLIWGRAHLTSTGADLNGYALESVARFRGRNYLTGRIELVDKNELFEEGNPLAGRTFRISSYTAGYTRDFYFVPRIATGLGANVTLYGMPPAVHDYYGQHPAAVLIFLRFRLRES